MGVRVSVLPRLPEVVGSSVERDEVDGITLLGMRRYGLTRSSRAVKRSFDVVGAGLGPARARPAPGGDRGRDQARLARPGPLPAAAHGPARRAVRDAQVPHDGRRGRRPAVRARGAQRGRWRALQDQGRSADHPGRAGSCAGPRSTSCPSCSTCCAATCRWSVPGPLVLDEDRQDRGLAAFAPRARRPG